MYEKQQKSTKKKESRRVRTISRSCKVEDENEEIESIEILNSTSDDIEEEKEEVSLDFGDVHQNS